MLTSKGKIDADVRRQINTLKLYHDDCDPRKNTDQTVGGLYISVEGLSRVAQMLLSGGEYGGVRLLKETTVREMEAAQKDLPGTSVHCDSPYGLSLARVDDLGGGPWYGHQGRYHGLVANVYYQPSTGLTFAFAAIGYNGSSTNQVANLTRKLLSAVMLESQ